MQKKEAHNQVKTICFSHDEPRQTDGEVFLKYSSCRYLAECISDIVTIQDVEAISPYTDSKLTYNSVELLPMVTYQFI